VGERSLASIEIAASLSAVAVNLMTIGGNSVSGLASLSRNTSLGTGIGAEQADRVWYWEGTITDGHSEKFWLASLGGLDIGAGVGNDMLGQAWDASEIVAIFIVNDNDIGNYAYLEITPGATIPVYWLGSHTVATGGAIGAQGWLFRYEPDLGLPVTAGVSESIRLFANGGDVSVKLVVLGRSTTNESSSSSSSTSSLTSSSSSSSVTSSGSSSSSSGHSSSSSSSSSSVTSSSSSSSVTSSSSSNSSSSSVSDSSSSS